MGHNGSVILHSTLAAYADRRIGRYGYMRLAAYNGSGICPYAHMPICAYNGSVVSAYAPTGLLQTSRNSNKSGNHYRSY